MIRCVFQTDWPNIRKSPTCSTLTLCSLSRKTRFFETVLCPYVYEAPGYIHIPTPIAGWSVPQGCSLWSKIVTELLYGHTGAEAKLDMYRSVDVEIFLRGACLKVYSNLPNFKGVPLMRRETGERFFFTQSVT